MQLCAHLVYVASALATRFGVSVRIVQAVAKADCKAHPPPPQQQAAWETGAAHKQDLQTSDMAGGETAINTADNTQELAELFDATLKFTSVLKKKGVSQSTLTVSTGRGSAKLTC